MKQFRLMTMAVAVGLLATAACSDFLEEKSQDEVIPSTTADYGEMLLTYMDIYEYAILYMLDDDVQISEIYYTPTSMVPFGGCFTWQPDMWELEGATASGYEETYSAIMGFNAVLDDIDGAVGTQEERDMVKAEALGLRALAYYYLVNLFGEPYNANKQAPGVPLKLTGVFEANGMSRNTVEEVYDQMVSDLEESSALFAKYPKRRGNYRMNGTTVDIILSRVYLYMEKWEDAVGAASRAIESAEGLTDYTQMPNGMEVPFFLASYDHSEVEWLYGYSYMASSYSFLEASSELLSFYASGDRRYDLWFPLAAYGMNIVDKKDPYNYEYLPTNTVRISEAYLNRAEARTQCATPDFAGALSDLNELRRHRITGYQDEQSTDNLLERIRTERRLELCFDWHRWFDLRRYGMPSISHDYKAQYDDPWMTYTLREKDPLYTLPLPTSAMENNMSLQQNPSASEQRRSGEPRV